MTTEFNISAVPMQENAGRPYGTSSYDPVLKALLTNYARDEAIEVHPMTGAQRRSLTQLIGRQNPEFRLRSKTVGDGFILWLERKA